MTQIRNTNIHSGVTLGGSNETISKSADYTITTSDIASVSTLFVIVDTSSDDVTITLPTAAQMSGMLITFWHETASNGMQINKQPYPGSGYYYSIQVDDWITIHSDGSTYLKMGSVMTIPGP
jgi:hypothetical protein